MRGGRQGHRERGRKTENDREKRDGRATNREVRGGKDRDEDGGRHRDVTETKFSALA